MSDHSGGLSSAGRAFASHARGQQFEPARPHAELSQLMGQFFCFQRAEKYCSHFEEYRGQTMYHFFVGQDQITDRQIRITGEDYNHAVRVLRLKDGEKVLVSGPDGKDYFSRVCGSIHDEQVLLLEIEQISGENHELPAEITLYMSLPKSDKMELIIQKATELGAARIVPVESKNCVMRLEPKKTAAKLSRWQAIAEAAAKQSKRSLIPEIAAPMSFTEAVREAETKSNVRLIPYEEEKGMLATCGAIVSFLPGTDISVFVGPEGGYDPLEILFAKNHGVIPVSLGKRILRAETAAIAILSLIMIRLEIAASPGMLGEE